MADVARKSFVATVVSVAVIVGAFALWHLKILIALFLLAIVIASAMRPGIEWLHEHVHRHGRKYPPRELLRRVTGEELRVDPFLRYLREKLADAGVLATAA